MLLITKVDLIGVGNYISLRGVSNTRRSINAKIYYHLLTNFPNETTVREYLVSDGPDEEWLKGISEIVIPFLRRHTDGTQRR